MNQKQSLQILPELEGRCIVCMNSINTPICKKCLSNEISQRMSDLKVNSASIRGFLHNLRKEENSYFSGEMCVICRKNSVPMCSTCLYLDTLGYLRKAHMPKKQKFKIISQLDYLML